jgi:hypothetical protein
MKWRCMLKTLLFSAAVLTVIPCTAAPIASGQYEGLLVGVDQAGLLTGYFESSTGKGQFSCVFFVSGKIAGSTASVKTWFPGGGITEKPIDGVLENIIVAGASEIKVKLEDEHGGCWNVQHFASEPAFFTLTRKGGWEAIRVVSSGKAYFHDHPSSATRRKAYLVTGNPIRVFESRSGWVRAQYASAAERISEGWILESDLYASKSKALGK